MAQRKRLQTISPDGDIAAALLVQARRQASVAELGQRALEGLDLNSLMSSSAALAARGLDVEMAEILERRPPDGSLRPRAAHGWRAGAGRTDEAPGSASHAGYTLLSAEPVIMEDLERETRFTPSARLRGAGALSGVAVAIAGREPELPFGVLAAYSTRRRSYGPDDVHFLETVAYVLAAAVIRKREDEMRRLLLERVMSAQEDERRRIARELHDETAQVLTSLLVGLRTVESAPTMSLAQTRASHLAAIAAAAIEAVGRLARGLHPSVLEDLGLGPALIRHATEHADVLGIRISVDERLGDSRLAREVETALFRIAQEALANVGKHARATQAWISLKRARRSVELVVEDDGCGFAVERTLPDAIASGRLGLLGIRERAAFLGGEAEIGSTPAGGTRISVRIPVTAASAAGAAP
jgi:signal transduction histidine kinase